MHMLTWTGCIAAALALTVWTGVLQGELANRWGEPADLQCAADHLKTFPRQIGVWKCGEDKKLSEHALQLLQCTGYLYREYENQTTGTKVQIAVLLGPTGPIAVHTPEICYSSRDYKIESERKKITLTDSSGARDSIWQLQLRSRGLEAEGLSVGYAWCGDQLWNAAEQPRFAFAGKPYLYKMQVAAQLPPGSIKSDEPDLAQQFLSEILPALRPWLRCPAKTL